MAISDEEGFLLLSTGDERKQWLFNLVASIREFYPDTPIHVLTDAPVDVPHTLIETATGLDSRFYKTRLYHYSPFERTIFLDDDTIVKRHFGSLEELLDGRNFGMALDPFARLGLWRGNVVRNCMGRHEAWDAFVRYVNPGNENSPYFNSGVMVWRRRASVRRLFDRWHEMWRSGGKGPDQTWLAMAILDMEMKMTELPLEMNFYPVLGHRFGHRHYPSLGEARVIHCLSEHGKRWMSETQAVQAPVHAAYREFKNGGRGAE